MEDRVGAGVGYAANSLGCVKFVWRQKQKDSKDKIEALEKFTWLN